MFGLTKTQGLFDLFWVSLSKSWFGGAGFPLRLKSSGPQLGMTTSQLDKDMEKFEVPPTLAIVCLVPEQLT